MKQVQLNVDDEFAAAGDAIKVLIADIKAGKSIAVITGDALPNLIVAIGGYANMAADVKKVDNQIYLVKSIADALEPVPVVA
jgi:hypothetical protein